MDLRQIVRGNGGHEEIALTVHSVSGTVVTVFLATRLWARTTYYGGLWRDDYILIVAWACLVTSNGLAAAAPSIYGLRMFDGPPAGIRAHVSSVSLMYAATALSKTAFAATLLRLTPSSSHATRIWAVIVVVCGFNLAMTVLTWLSLCDSFVDTSIAVSGRCVPMPVAVSIHLGNCITGLVADVLLASFPWRIISGIPYISSKEKWGVSASMSLVGLAAILGVAKAVWMSGLKTDDPAEDFTYGAVVLACLYQAEAAVVIMAQTVPLVRVLFQGSAANSIAARAPRTTEEKKKATASQGETVSGADDIELVALPSGKIVAADSEEGKAFQATELPAARTGPADVDHGAESTQPANETVRERAASRATVDDDLHRMWADMGLSRRAWSASPEPAR